MRSVQANWLPTGEDWQARLGSLKGLAAAETAARLRELATCRLDLTQVAKLDRSLARVVAANGGQLPGLEPVRLAVLGSATTSHLPPGIRVAGLRRGLAVEVYEAPYGMYWQELMDAGSGVYGFGPQAVLLALDARHVAALGGAEAAVERMRVCWRQAKAALGCQVIQQTAMPVLPRPVTWAAVSSAIWVLPSAASWLADRLAICAELRLRSATEASASRSLPLRAASWLVDSAPSCTTPSAAACAVLRNGLPCRACSARALSLFSMIACLSG